MLKMAFAKETPNKYLSATIKLRFKDDRFLRGVIRWRKSLCEQVEIPYRHNFLKVFVESILS